MLSPITLREAPFDMKDFYGIHVGMVDHTDDGLGRFYASEKVFMSLRDNAGQAYFAFDEKYDVPETRAALNLIRSYLWRKENRGGPSLLVTDAQSTEPYIDLAFKNHPRARAPMIRSFGSFVREARSLTLVQRATETLDNFYALHEQNKLPGYIQYVEIDVPTGKVAVDDIKYGQKSVENGCTYGCDELSGPFVIEYLFTEGFLRWQKRTEITAKGFDLVDGLRRGIGHESNTVFLVRRWDEDLDKILVPACNMAAQELGVPIEPVWAREHNEKIDERVFRSLRQALAVVVDLTPDRKERGDRINVGIEAGYAMALGKTIVAIRQEPSKLDDPDWHQQRPFDITTLSCFDYGRKPTPEVIAELAEKLVARVGLAIDLQREPLHRHSSD